MHCRFKTVVPQPESRVKLLVVTMADTFSKSSIPAGNTTVQVRIVDTTARIGKLPLTFLMRPALEPMEFMPTLPSWSFLIEHPSGHKAVFDLGMPRNIKDLAPLVSQDDRFDNWDIQSPKEVIDVLEEHNVPASQINSAIWRFVDSSVNHLLTLFIDVTTVVTGTGITSEIHHGFHQART